MGRGFLTEEDVKILNNNPNVLYAMENRIIYSPAFKAHFIKEYQSGKRPGTIFKEAGFDTKMLGSKRIERASARWRKADYIGSLSTYDATCLRQQHDEKNEAAQRKQAEKMEKELIRKIKKLEEKLTEKDKQIIELQNRLRFYDEIDPFKAL